MASPSLCGSVSGVGHERCLVGVGDRGVRPRRARGRRLVGVRPGGPQTAGLPGPDGHHRPGLLHLRPRDPGVPADAVGRQDPGRPVGRAAAHRERGLVADRRRRLRRAAHRSGGGAHRLPGAAGGRHGRDRAQRQRAAQLLRAGPGGVRHHGRRDQSAQGDTQPPGALQGPGGPGPRGELPGTGLPGPRGHRGRRRRGARRDHQEDRVLPLRLPSGPLAPRPPRPGQRRPVRVHLRPRRGRGRRTAGLRRGHPAPVGLHRLQTGAGTGRRAVHEDLPGGPDTADRQLVPGQRPGPRHPRRGGRKAEPGTDAGLGDRLAFSDGPKSDGRPQLLPRPVALSLFTLVVSEDTGVRDLSLKQVRDIYAGRITNWSQVKGRDLPIQLVSRHPGSGTRSALEKRVLDGRPLPAVTTNDCRSLDTGRPGRCEVGGTPALLDTVATTPGALGHSEVGSAAAHEGVRQVRIDGYPATLEGADQGTYPFWETEIAYTYGEPPADSIAAGFLHYLADEVGKDVIRSQGHRPCSELDKPLVCRPAGS
ncbi:substrate-binding domain-containing protein [Streptomyces parvulus]|nr:substrate-binding domain-containing protein [Streptomyces parvulus]